MTTQPKAMTNLEDVIGTYSDDAKGLYQSVHDVAVGLVKPPPKPADVKDTQNQDVKDAQNQDVKDAQSQLAGAFSQLGTAAKMEADQIDRAGLAAVVQLMQTTADNAEKISEKLVAIFDNHQPGTPLPADFYAVTSALTSALGVLAQLSPSAVWTTR